MPEDADGEKGLISTALADRPGPAQQGRGRRGRGHDAGRRAQVRDRQARDHSRRVVAVPRGPAPITTRYSPERPHGAGAERNRRRRRLSRGRAARAPRSRHQGRPRRAAAASARSARVLFARRRRRRAVGATAASGAAAAPATSTAGAGRSAVWRGARPALLRRARRPAARCCWRRARVPIALGLGMLGLESGAALGGAATPDAGGVGVRSGAAADLGAAPGALRSPSSARLVAGRGRPVRCDGRRSAAHGRAAAVVRCSARRWMRGAVAALVDQRALGLPARRRRAGATPDARRPEPPLRRPARRRTSVSPGFRELLLAVHDLDARRDLVFGLLGGAVPASARSPRPRPPRRGAPRRIDLARRRPRARSSTSCGGALTLPASPSRTPSRFAAEAFWRGEVASAVRSAGGARAPARGGRRGRRRAGASSSSAAPEPPAPHALRAGPRRCRSAGWASSWRRPRRRRCATRCAISQHSFHAVVS